MNVKIGTKIKALRRRDGVTQEKLADALGVTPQAVSKWENEDSLTNRYLFAFQCN